ncbi:hypothetical protein [cf. Phormidesmis sp. LEGE 11477]|uniref:hypothetical protein n=1 Tax=cf. Phormidesmis sp. LEGE 11477 TaxID=1828680 RepID=UPI00187E87B0|nr:hypothetical protein [cf. Phormidesmis sp. LEGE 11477]MBE9063204.1 hypothetical protein [cf. Phormidesmis sp. LEGE 11477]
MSVSMRFVCVSEASQATAVEVLGNSENAPVTPFQLREFVSMVRGGPVLSGTLRTWRKRIGIKPNAAGFYTMDDLRLLGRYLEALAAGRTTDQFLNQEYGDYAQDRPA